MKRPAEPSLFAHAAKQRAEKNAPLAERLRPESLADFLGQSHLVGDGKLLGRLLDKGQIPSMILWGPPGVGKTTLARMFARRADAEFVPWSAINGTAAELRNIVAEATERRDLYARSTILFVDEIHRFNKGQQDAFLPHVESGLFRLIGATTENPSFAVNAALLSRCRVFHLEPLDAAAIRRLLERALLDRTRGFGALGLTAAPELLDVIAERAGGDARRALSTLELVVEMAHSENRVTLGVDDLTAASDERTLLYDKSGEEHYAVVSAFIKSMRGSDPDAAVYWMMRMLDAGDDPLFVMRRMLIFASEDIGNADPNALCVVTAADHAFRRVGMPEGYYPLAHAATYLALAPKSNAVGTAWQRARALIERDGALPVPKKLRPASNASGRALGHGADYKYAHDYAGNVVEGETYLPDALVGETLYPR